MLKIHSFLNALKDLCKKALVKSYHLTTVLIVIAAVCIVFINQMNNEEIQKVKVVSAKQSGRMIANMSAFNETQQKVQAKVQAEQEEAIKASKEAKRIKEKKEKAKANKIKASKEKEKKKKNKEKSKSNKKQVKSKSMKAKAVLSTSNLALSKKDIEILTRIVEAETTGGDIKSKLMVANVILNRVEDETFPDTIEGVVFQKLGKTAQFSPISDGRYYSVSITKESKEAVERAISGEDNSKGALFFACRKYSSSKNMRWFDNNLLYLFEYGGHEFFTLK